MAFSTATPFGFLSSDSGDGLPRNPGPASYLRLPDTLIRRTVGILAIAIAASFLRSCLS